MKKTGYLIAKNKGLTEFFTSSSAYDRPRWVSLEEATSYPTAELAQAASTKLYKSSGAYEARTVSVMEAIHNLHTLIKDTNEFISKMPDRTKDNAIKIAKFNAAVDAWSDGDANDAKLISNVKKAANHLKSIHETRGRDVAYAEQPYDDSDPSGIMQDGATGDETTSKMTARSQGRDPSIDPEADDQMGLADTEHSDDEEDQADIEELVDDELEDGIVGMAGEDEPVDVDLNIPFDSDEENENSQLRPEEVAMMTRNNPRTRVSAYDSAQQLRGMPNVTESATMPNKPLADAKPTDNKTTANTMKATPVIGYKDPANKADRPDTDLTHSGAEAHEDKVKVPAAITKDLKTAIAEFEKAAKFANTRDDAKATFCMTVVEAFRELLDYLNIGTVESMKLAQIHMSSWMSPISNHLPESVKKFVLMGGRKPTLKDLFDSKRISKRVI